MEYKGAAVYDDDEFFGNYLTRRHRAESPNNIIEKPVLDEYCRKPELCSQGEAASNSSRSNRLASIDFL